MNRQIISNEIESVIYKLPKNKILGLDDFTGKFYQTFLEDLITIQLKLFQNTKGGGILPNLFYKTTITLMPKLNKDNTKTENDRSISLMSMDAKFLNSASAKLPSVVSDSL